jgi:hypothetical protein
MFLSVLCVLGGFFRTVIRYRSATVRAVAGTACASAIVAQLVAQALIH